MRFTYDGVYALMGTNVISVNGVTPAGLIGIDAGAPRPFNSTLGICQNVTAGAVLNFFDYVTGALTSADAAGMNFLAAGGGNWQAQLSSGPSVGVRMNAASGFGARRPTAALGDVDGEGRYAVLTSNTGVGLQFYSAVGAQTAALMPTIGIPGIKCRSGLCTYNDATSGWQLVTMATGAPANFAQQSAEVTTCIPITLGSSVYVVEYVTDVGVVVRLANSGRGYILPGTTGGSFNIDAAPFSANVIRVGMSSGAGEAPTELRVFEVNVQNGALRSGVTTSGALVFTSQPALPASTFPTSGGTGEASLTANLAAIYQQAIAEKSSLKATRVWYLFFQRIAKLLTAPFNLSNVTGVLPPANGGTGTTTGLTDILPSALQFSGESLLLGRGEGAGGGDGQEISLGPGLQMTGTVLDTTGAGSFIPLVDGSEPPNFITDGSGNLILVPYTP